MADETPVVTDGTYRPPVTREEHDRAITEVNRERDQLQKTLAKSNRRLEDTLAAFLRYARHADDCDGGNGDHCECGYTVAWRRCLQLAPLAPERW